MPGLEPFHPLSLVFIAALNPVVIAVAFLMGRSADQWQKLVLAAFAASIAGSALVWVAAFIEILPAKGIGGEGGVFVLQLVFGLFWAWLGYATRRRAKSET